MWLAVIKKTAQKGRLELVNHICNVQENIISSEESTFTINGVPLSQICRYWYKNNSDYVILLNGGI